LPFSSFSMRLDSRPIAASPSHWWSVPSCAIPQLLPYAPFFALPWRFSAYLLNAISARVVSCSLAAMPLLFSSFLFSASRLHAPPSQHCSCQSPSIPPPFRCLSAHLRLHRSWPFPCSSHRFGSWLCHIPASRGNAVSNHLRYSQRRSVSSLFTASLNKADQIRCRSCPGASGYAQRCRIRS